MRSLLASFIALFIIGCGAAGAPDWTLMPPSDGKIYGVGSSPIHVKGQTFQRALAVSRAIDEIASQKKVKVTSTLERAESIAASGKVFSAAQKYSVQTVEGQDVSAQIKEIYQDPRSKRIFVLMISN